MAEEKTAEIEQIPASRMVSRLGYWMVIQGIATFDTLHNYATHKYGVMWISIALLVCASLMLWYKIEKWRTP